ncbi:type II toxin-antitoxin system RelE/ParE family toxin [Achromobacter mucicolens]|uniref:type II toxin-antitoxin system RelE/ParE family toxin n=1 Tax=Achromobacter mucicolens TaxID=1389922 RepID=UPI0020A38963|nr:type II toxin-antitoxin system RelE/ParE family toxin [Achromobacter mucicolens]MCP2516732.1 type II toxin-antitoxin system RelE/ParE family toxin [Achromobacter mucicolens]
MKEVESTSDYDEFRADLKDLRALAIIRARIERLRCGNPGSYRRLEKGVSELKIDFGPGYRVYYTERHDGTLVVLLAGGDKSTQQADIARAYRLVASL